MGVYGKKRIGYIPSRVITPDSVANPQPLARALQDLSRSVVTAQQVLDTDYTRSSEEFLEFKKVAEGSGFEALVRFLAPVPLCLVNAEIELQFICFKATKYEFSILVLNACWMSRFQTAISKRHLIRFELVRTPAMVKMQPDVQPEEFSA
jgi:hypothetical protein